MCRMIVEETKMGRYEDKLEKHLAVINKTPGPDCLNTEAISGDEGLMLEEYAPFGVIAAITPTTNPTEMASVFRQSGPGAVSYTHLWYRPPR